MITNLLTLTYLHYAQSLPSHNDWISAETKQVRWRNNDYIGWKLWGSTSNDICCGTHVVEVVHIDKFVLDPIVINNCEEIQDKKDIYWFDLSNDVGDGSIDSHEKDNF